jgi:hypothetical protein
VSRLAPREAAARRERTTRHTEDQAKHTPGLGTQLGDERVSELRLRHGIGAPDLAARSDERLRRDCSRIARLAKFLEPA